MSFLKSIYDSIGNWRFASEASDKYIEAFQQINAFIPCRDPSKEGVVQIVIAYANLDESGINAEINRIFQAEAWASPLSSSKNQLFVTQYASVATELVLPPNSMQHVDRIAQRIASMTSLKNLIVRVSANMQNSLKILDFYRKTLHLKPTIGFMSFEEVVPLSELSAATLNQPLETLLVSRFVRNSEATVKDQEGDAKAKQNQESLAGIVTRFRNLRRLKINQAGLTDNELLDVCSACARIQYLEVARNALSHQALATTVRQLPALTALDISGMRNLQVADFATLAERPFRKLVLADCLGASDGTLMGTLRRISTLIVLDISGIRLNDADFKELAAFSGLRVLTMKECFEQNDEIFKPNQLYARSIGNLRSLVELDIRGCKIDSRDFEHITSSLRNLRKISCGRWLMNERPAEKPGQDISLTVKKPDRCFTAIIEKRKKDHPKLEISFESISCWTTTSFYTGDGELPRLGDYE
jgi:hypothetical protein